MKKNNSNVYILTQGALLAALCYIGFQFLRFDIPIAGGKTAIHFGNAFCVLAALLLNNPYGILAGSIGMTIADLTSGYATSAPKTFFLKLCIALVVHFVVHKVAKINSHTEKKYIFKWILIGSVSGMVFNTIADPIVTFFYKKYLWGVQTDLASALAKMTAVTTFVNAITAVAIAVCAYCALRPILVKSGLLKLND